MTLFKGKIDGVFLFPGIGVKPFGGEKEFYVRYRTIIQPFLEPASAIAGVDLSESLLDNTTFDNDQLSREVFAYSFSCATFQVFRELGLKPTLMAGHSLGVYAALASSGAISFDEGLAVTRQAHILGSQCCPGKEFGVVVIIGLTREEIRKILEDRKLYTVNLANFNNDISGVYVGCREETDTLLSEADDHGAAKTIRLRINIPFHNPQFMNDVSRRLNTYLGSLKWKEPVCSIVSALDHSLCSTREELMRMIVANLSRPIYWPGVMDRLRELGIGSVIECGYGISLSQHARLIDFAPRHYNLKNLKRRLGY